MQFKIMHNLYFADSSVCTPNHGGKLIHACKHPCYHTKAGKTFPLDSNYLFQEEENDLYLNIVDSDKPIYHIEIFQSAIKFIDKHIINQPVIIHCNQGISRAPTIGLVYIAKRLPILKNMSYLEVKKIFIKEFNYWPSKGLQIFLNNNWDNI